MLTVPTGPQSIDTAAVSAPPSVAPSPRSSKPSVVFMAIEAASGTAVLQQQQLSGTVSEAASAVAPSPAATLSSVTAPAPAAAPAPTPAPLPVSVPAAAPAAMHHQNGNGNGNGGGASSSVAPGASAPSAVAAAGVGVDAGEMAPPAPPSGVITDANKASCLYWMTKIQPTNYDMLLFRTLNQDLKMPNHNKDYLAVKMRDELMPIRSWCIKHLPWVKYQMRAALESQLFGVPGCINFIDARTKWFDAAVVEATTWKNIRQVVQIAAGYDTRAYRLAQPGVTFYEVDLPSASTRKQMLVEKLKMVSPGGRRPVYVAADLSRVSLSAALKGTSFDPTLPTLFTVEGLIYYLPEAAAHRLISSIGSLAPSGSMLYFDYMQLAALTGQAHKYPGFKVTAKAVAAKNEPYLSGLDDTPEAVQQFVGLHGFRLQQHLSPRDMVATMLPHITYDEASPPIASFYSYASVIKE